MVAERKRPDGLGEVEQAVNQFCRCFNRGDYFEAHEVLEGIWLPLRRTVEGELWQGFIQLAAAFVHVQRGRRGPALSLLRTAGRRLKSASTVCSWGDVRTAIQLADHWGTTVEGSREPELPALLRQNPPQLGLRQA